MDEIVVSKRPNGRFSAFSAACGYTRAERAFLKKHAFSPRNPLFANGPVRFVTVNGKDGVRARVMTGADRVYEARTGCKRGYFALLDSAGDDGRALSALRLVLLSGDCGAGGVGGSLPSSARVGKCGDGRTLVARRKRLPMRRGRGGRGRNGG